MKNLEDFDSIDDLKKAISNLTQKYEQLKHNERTAKISEVKEIIEIYDLSAEELGFGRATAVKKPAMEKTAVRRRMSSVAEEQAPNSGQQGLW